MAFFEAQSRAAKGHDYVMVYQTSYAISLLYPLASSLPKLSLCALYLRVFNISRWGRHATYVIISLVIANMIAWLVPSIMVCRPISAYWSLKSNRGKCLDTDILGTWISLPNIVTDVMMLILPIPILWKTQMGVPKKLGLILTFATGSAGCIGACIRLASYIKRVYVVRGGTQVTTSKSSCITSHQKCSIANASVGTISVNVIVTYLECGMYLIAACLPSLRILFVRFHKKVTSGFNSLFKGRWVYISDDQHLAGLRQGLDRDSDKILADKLFVKLTNIGNLDTLACQGELIGKDDSGSPHEQSLEQQLRMTDVARAESQIFGVVDRSGPVCHVCQCRKSSIHPALRWPFESAIE